MTYDLLSGKVDDRDDAEMDLNIMESSLPGCGQRTSVESARLQPCASRRGARP